MLPPSRISPIKVLGQVSQTVKGIFAILYGGTGAKRWLDYARLRIPRIFHRFSACLILGANDRKISNGSNFTGIGVKVAITRGGSSVFHNEIFFDYLSRHLFSFSYTREHGFSRIHARYYFIESFFFILARKLHALSVKGFSPTHRRLRDINFIRTLTSSMALFCTQKSCKKYAMIIAINNSYK